VALGQSATLQNIALCLVQKVLATQPKGPYTVGGLCIGGILAFEIACQLRAAGHEVALVVLLDPPSPSYLESPELLRPRLSHPGYLLKKAAQMGARKSVVKVGQRVFRRFSPPPKASPPRTEVDIAQDLIEAAASRYIPEKYYGRVLLLLASERPPHLNFLPEWQALVPNELHTQYLDAPHSELTKGLSVQLVADAIFSHLTSVAAFAD
jgi:thioesterase domain-containing protein